MAKKKTLQKAFHCDAAGYEDKPHFWTQVSEGVEQYVYDQSGYTLAGPKTCSGHMPSVELTPEMLEAAVNTEGAMPGFVGKVSEYVFHGNGKEPLRSPQFNLDGDGIHIEVIFWIVGQPKSRYDIMAGGHTSFTTDKGTRTFDRTGVEDSFYLHHNNGVAGAIAIMKEQIAKVAATRARIAGMETVPGIGYLISPDKKAEIVAAMATRNGYLFTPSGFGTGYRLSLVSVRYGSTRAKPETEAYFGVGPIFIQELDCD